ncbi:MAG: acyltransferase family protein [Acidimicrobiia bacterium]
MTQAESRLRYQPALDGLRAVAVLAVIAYHDGYSWAKGGFLGVDAFFVLSGFLITSLLVLEYQRIQSIELVAFWGRRARRLLPALLLVLVAVAIYGAVDVSSFELAQLRGDALSSLFYFTNWRFIAEHSSYFTFFTRPSPVRHLWSLAIEEQFYLVWPLIVFACLRLGHGRRRVLVAVTAVGAVVSTFVMAGLYDSTDPSRAYYGTDSRSHTILIGALLALWLIARPPKTQTARRAVQVTGLVGGLGMLVALHGLSDQSSSYYHGGSALYAVAVAALIAAVVQPAPTFMRLGLGFAPVVWIGRISYGLYLWHWPVNVVLDEARVGFGGTQLNVLRLVVTFALATASYYLLEMPIRRGALRTRPERWLAPAAVAFTGVAILASTAGAEPIPSYLAGGAKPASSLGVKTGSTATTATTAPLPAAVFEGAETRSTLGPGSRTNIGVSACPDPRSDELAAARTAARRAGPGPLPQPGGPVRVLVIGDSLACSVNVGLEPAAQPAIVTRQIAMVGCGVVSDEVYAHDDPYPKLTEQCHRIVTGREQDALVRFHPKVVLWISTWERFNLVDQDKVLTTGSEAWHDVLQRRMDAAYAMFAASGARVVITTVAPPAPAALMHGGRVVGPQFDWRFGSLNEAIEEFAARHPDGVTLVDVARKVCPEGLNCPAVVDGFEPRHVDGFHFQPEGAVWLTRWMLPALLTPPTGSATP